jgi:hypothetical protein
VFFKLTGNRATYPEGERVEKAGKWILANPSEAYETVLTEVDCTE